MINRKDVMNAVLLIVQYVQADALAVGTVVGHPPAGPLLLKVIDRARRYWERDRSAGAPRPLARRLAGLVRTALARGRAWC